MPLASVLVFVQLVGWFAFVLFACRVIPVFERLFVERNSLLPPITQYLLTFSHWMIGFWYLPALALLVPGGPLMLVVCRFPERVAWMKWAWVTFFLFVLLCCVGVSSCILPMTLWHGGGAVADRL
jgi:type II secretory pathway component PulF